MFCNVRKVAQSLTTDPANSSSNQQRCSLLLFTIHSIYQRESGIANNSSFKSTKLAVLKRNVFKGIERHKAQNRDTPSTILIFLLFLLVTIPNKRVREKGQRERDQHPYFFSCNSITQWSLTSQSEQHDSTFSHSSIRECTYYYYFLPYFFPLLLRAKIDKEKKYS